ncbi:TPA: hypothetical protein ACOJM5_001890 [Pseudomonas putida]|nr:hypothetical protein [Pseudomonas aeruginosa]
MIPKFVRVAAVDNERDHLEKIHSALVSAGFWAMPFLYDLGSVKPLPPSPYNGVRIIFSDIHLVDGGMNNMAQQALAIIACLKKIVCDGPYALIFWTQFPQDAEQVFREILARTGDDLIAPVGFGCIDKSLVLGLEENPERLPELLTQINVAIESCGALLLSISWEERVSQAAIRSTYRLFDLAHQKAAGGSLEQWHQLLAYLAVEAVGEPQARRTPVSAMDAALLPILEDRLHVSAEDVAPLNALLEEKIGAGTGAVSKSSLNAHYLVSTLGNAAAFASSRGVVSVINKEGWDADQLELWGQTCNQVLVQEFFLSGQQNVDDALLGTLKPCVVTLTPECDDVQGKVGSFRYLLGVLIPYSEAVRGRYYSKSKRQYSNLSIFDVGVLSVDVGDGVKDYCLLISCNRFFAKPTAELLNVEPKLRLRRATLEELSHHYATHARRPGVMRFSVY